MVAFGVNSRRGSETTPRTCVYLAVPMPKEYLLNTQVPVREAAILTRGALTHPPRLANGEMSQTSFANAPFWGDSSRMEFPVSVPCPGLRIRVFECLEDLATLVPEWEGLLADCPGASIFSTWEWLSSWWLAFGASQKLLVLSFHDCDSGLVGLAPLALATKRAVGLSLRVVRLMGDGNGDSDNLDILCRAGFQTQVAQAAFEFIERQLSWDLCELNTVPVESPSARRLLDHLKVAAWPHCVRARPSLAITLPDNWESYRQTLSRNERSKIGNLSRRLQKKYKVRYYKCAEASERTLCLEHLFRLHQKRWESRGQRGTFCSAKRRQFYSDLSLLLLKRNQLDFWLLELDGNTVAALFGFRYRDTVYTLQEGFDPSYRSDCVGYLLRAHVLCQLIAAGVRRYDFLAGLEPAKKRWGAEAGSYVDVHFAKPRSLGGIYLRSVECRSRAKEWLRTHLPQSAWIWLRKINIYHHPMGKTGSVSFASQPEQDTVP